MHTASPCKAHHLLILGALLVSLAGCGGCDDDKPTPVANNNANNNPNNNPNNSTNNAPNNGTNNDPNNGTNNDPCPRGTATCPCHADNTCDTGLTCEQELCVATTGMGLSVSSPDARSCEIAFNEGATRLLGASYTGGVRGKLLRRPPHVALALTQTADAAIPAGAVQLQLDGAASGLTLSSVRCFDRAGQPLDGVEVTLP